MQSTKPALGSCLILAGLCFVRGAAAQSDYYRHVFFDNSHQAGAYWQSGTAATAPSRLESAGERLPVESKVFRTPPNALRIEWQSAPGGSWDAKIHLVNFPNRHSELSGDTLYFWLYSPEGLAAADLPNVVLSDVSGGQLVANLPGSFTASEPLATCPTEAGWKSAFHSPSCARRTSIRSTRNACKASSSTSGAPMAPGMY
jgi:hypothetical protein